MIRGDFLERVGVFIDNGYLKKVLANAKLRIDYLSFSEGIVTEQGGKRFRTYVYDCKPYLSNPPTEEEKERQSRMDKFQGALERLPCFVTRWGDLQKIETANGTKFNQKGVDLLLGIDLLKLSLKNTIETAMVVAGDRDFVPAIKEAKEAGVLVYLYYDPNTYVHNELYDLCDNRFKLDKELLTKYEINADK